MESEAAAMVFDLDNTLIRRTSLERIAAPLIQRVYCHNLPTTQTEIAWLDIDHSPTNQPINSLIERISFELTAKRGLFPGIAEEIKRLIDEGYDIYANTGRPNKPIWADMTNEILDKEGIVSFFKQIFYTPQDTDVAISKAHALHIIKKTHDNLEFSDDDARVAQFIASIFPDIKVNLIRHLQSTRSNLQKIPNLRIIPDITTRQQTNLKH